MKTVQLARFGTWLMIAMTMLMAWGCIWLFIRMTPADRPDNDRNWNALQLSGEMLTLLALPADDENSLKQFRDLTEKLKRNSAQTEEKTFARMLMLAQPALSGRKDARRELVRLIRNFAEAHRKELTGNSRRQWQFGRSGAWGVVFMALLLLTAGLLYKRHLIAALLLPAAEVEQVLEEHKQGNPQRRCTGVELPQDVRKLFDNLNALLDEADEAHR